MAGVADRPGELPDQFGRVGASKVSDSSLGPRLFAAAVTGPIVLACAIVGGWWFAGLILLVTGIAAWEWSALQEGGRSLRAFGVAAGLAFPVSAAMGQPMVAPAVLGVTISLGVAMLSSKVDMKESLSSGAVAVVGSIYVGALLAPTIGLRAGENGLAWVLIIILGTWACDTMAFVVGRRWGKRRLALSISPQKTVEGTIAGVAAAVVVGLGGGLVFPALALKLAGLGVVVGLSTVAGDLVESVVKRCLGVKDAGWILPGHGGILDRIDGQILAALFGYLYVTVMP